MANKKSIRVRRKNCLRELITQGVNQQFDPFYNYQKIQAFRSFKYISTFYVRLI